MIDLSKISGLPIELTDDFHLKFNAPMKEFPVTFSRKFSEMQPVLWDPNVQAPQETYYVYRRLSLPPHEQQIRNQHLEYDITIIPPLMLGSEFNKTAGHYHANIPGKNIAHPEAYEIIRGSALIILQKMDEKFEQVLDVITIAAKTGDRIIYPSNYGHILVNIGSEALVTANWLSTDYQPLYEPVAQKHGMAYYAVKSGSGFELIPNANYPNHPEIKAKTAAPESEPMYTWGVNHPEQLDFLNNPH